MELNLDRWEPFTEREQLLLTLGIGFFALMLMEDKDTVRAEKLSDAVAIARLMAELSEKQGDADSEPVPHALLDRLAELAKEEAGYDPAD